MLCFGSQLVLFYSRRCAEFLFCFSLKLYQTLDTLGHFLWPACCLFLGYFCSISFPVSTITLCLPSIILCVSDNHTCTETQCTANRYMDYTKLFSVLGHKDTITCGQEKDPPIQRLVDDPLYPTPRLQDLGEPKDSMPRIWTTMSHVF